MYPASCACRAEQCKLLSTARRDLHKTGENRAVCSLRVGRCGMCALFVYLQVVIRMFTYERARARGPLWLLRTVVVPIVQRTRMG